MGWKLGAGLVAAVVGSLLAAPWVAAAVPPPPVRILNTNGSALERDWTVVFGSPMGIDPHNIVLDNGRVRVAYPPTELTEKAGHVIYVRTLGKWVLAGDPEFGDWTYTGSSFTDPMTNFAIVKNTAEVAQTDMSFDFHRHEYMGNASLPVKKSIILRRGAYGYRAILNVPSDLPGEREVGFGGTPTHLFSYTTKMGILWNPFDPPPENAQYPVDYVYLRDQGQTIRDWWGASIAFDRGYYRFVGLRPTNPAGLRTGQFAWGHTGHLIHWAFEGFSSYEAFVAAVPYNGLMARRVTVRNGVATVHVPTAGTYNLMTRAIAGRRHTYLPAKNGLRLKAGWNNVDVRGIRLVAPIIVPFANGVALPEDISRLYRAGKFD